MAAVATAYQAAPAKTLISDVIYRADGTPASGTLLISWPAFVTADNRAVAAGNASFSIGSGGQVELELVPNANSEPAGTYYKVVLKLDDGTSAVEYWVVPATSPTTISVVRASIAPANVAVQSATRQYVDAQLATKANDDAVVHKTGDESIAGVKSGGTFAPDDIKTKGPWVDVRAFGAIGDAKVATDCWMTSGSAVLTCASNHFTAQDVGKVIGVWGAGAASSAFVKPLASTIAAYTSATQVTLANTASTSNVQNLCTITSASWDTSGTMTVTCAAGHGFAVNQEVVFSGTGDDAVDNHVFKIATTDGGAGFTASGNGSPDAPHTISTGTVSGRSRRVVWGTDNTSAIQTAVNSKAMTSNDDQTGAVVYFPPGHYLTKGIQAACAYIGENGCTSHYNNFWFMGTGRDTSKLENWDPETTVHGIFSLGGSATDAHRLHAVKISGLSILQVQNPSSNSTKTIDTVRTEYTDIFDNYISGQSYECYYDPGGIRAWKNRVHDNYFKDCGWGGPAYGNVLAAINGNGSHFHAYNNYVEKAGQCFESGSRNALIEGNFCTNDAQFGWGINIGNTGAGTWDVVVRNNTFRNTSGYSVSNGIGTMNRIHITHNTFINAGRILLGDGAASNSWGSEVDSVVHGTSEFSYNTMWYPSTAPMAEYWGATVQAAYERWEVRNNTFEFAGQPDNGKPNFISLAGLVHVWRPSVTYSLNALIQPVRPAQGNSFYKVTTAGTSGATEPVWCTTTACTVTDGTVTWTYQGKMPIHSVANNRIVGVGKTGGTNIAPGEISLLYVRPHEFVMEGNSVSYPGAAIYLWGDPLGYTRPYLDHSTSVGHMPLPMNTPVGDSSRYPWDSLQASYGHTWQDTAPVMGYYRVGQKIWKYKPADGSSPYWLVTREGFGAQPWQANFSSPGYAYGYWVRPITDNGHFYIQIASATCTSGGSEPSWPTATGATVTDNNCTWQEAGTAAAFVQRDLSGYLTSATAASTYMPLAGGTFMAPGPGGVTAVVVKSGAGQAAGSGSHLFEIRDINNALSAYVSENGAAKFGATQIGGFDFGYTTNGVLGAGSGQTIAWANTGGSGGTKDVGLSRTAAGVLAVGAGAQGSTAGTLQDAAHEVIATNGAKWRQGYSTELITLSTSGNSTDSSGNLLPANSIIESVVCKVTTSITVATDWAVGDAVTAARFCSPNSTMDTTASCTGLNHTDGGLAAGAGMKQSSAAKLRITTTGTPGAGAVRCTTFYSTFTAPTS
ncbi:MAG: hypothetical protein ACE14M_00340 [Terriglobales bacterium]